MAGGTPESFDVMDAWARAKEVSRHPKAAALFFDYMMKAFIKIILRHGDNRHCHMLIWVRGNLSPQKLRDRMVRDSGMTTAIPPSQRGRLKKPSRAEGTDVRATEAPFLRDGMMAVECNWHEHRDTCFKNLKPGQPKDDSHCRMRIDGITRSVTELDDDTFSILLRRLHPWINNFNDLIIFLMKCNMDIKFIGSTHLGLDALCYAIRANMSKFTDDHDVAQSTIHRSLLGGGDNYTSDVFRTLYFGELDRFIWNAAHTSESHPDDVEPDDEYELDNIPNAQDFDEDITTANTAAAVAAQDAADAVLDGSHEEGYDSIEGQQSLLLDYIYRSCHPSFENLCVWQHVSLVEKRSMTTENTRRRQRRERVGPCRADRVEFIVPRSFYPKSGQKRRGKRAVVSRNALAV